MVSSWCIGLKSPEAPAYFTKCVRERFSTTSGGAASPTRISAKVGTAGLYPGSPRACRARGARTEERHPGDPEHARDRDDRRESAQVVDGELVGHQHDRR